jgi:isopentenyl diphosphate isomerase/L-lactate dehydrogenase-like FMN-dependent dehydrogenase
LFTTGAGSALAAHSRATFGDSLTWDVLGEIASWTSLPVVVKGILAADDAREAVLRRVRGIVVSNHGGRQLDTVLPTVEALPAVVDAVARAVRGVPRWWRASRHRHRQGAPLRCSRGFSWGELSTSMALLGVASVAELDARVPDVRSP